MKQRTEELRRKSKKTKYRVTNWHEYDAALVKRGSVEVWMDEAALSSWYAEKSVGEYGGRSRLYSDAAILCAATFRRIFRLPLRATEGLMTSLLAMSEGTLKAPDYSTVSRRMADVPIHLARRKKEKTVIVIDSTGAKVYGEGEWKVRQHGPGKRRTWKKIHIAIGEDGEVRATEVTDSTTHDAEVEGKLLDKEDPETEIKAFAADGAYDHRKVYNDLADRGVSTILIPPRKDANIWFHGNRKDVARHARDENLRSIRKHGRKQWKVMAGYHVRSLIENTMFRYKTIFGDKVASRKPENQTTELTLGCRILNIMFYLGMPKSVSVVV